MARFTGLLLLLVEKAVSGGVRGVSAEGAPDLDRRRASRGALRAFELPVALVSADVAVVFLPAQFCHFIILLFYLFVGVLAFFLLYVFCALKNEK